MALLNWMALNWLETVTHFHTTLLLCDSAIHIWNVLVTLDA